MKNIMGGEMPYAGCAATCYGGEVLACSGAECTAVDTIGCTSTNDHKICP